jgi:hypothetical protein
MDSSALPWPGVGVVAGRLGLGEVSPGPRVVGTCVGVAPVVADDDGDGLLLEVALLDVALLLEVASGVGPPVQAASPATVSTARADRTNRMRIESPWLLPFYAVPRFWTRGVVPAGGCGGCSSGLPDISDLDSAYPTLTPRCVAAIRPVMAWCRSATSSRLSCRRSRICPGTAVACSRRAAPFAVRVMARARSLP